MQAPPSYQLPPTQAPNRNVNRTLWIVAGVILLTCCIGIGIGGYFIFAAMKNAMPMIGCSMHIADIDAALREYAAAHDGKLPHADKWQDEIAPYFRDTSGEIPLSPRYSLEGDVGCRDQDGRLTSGLAFNEEVSGKVLADLAKEDPAIVFEIEQVGRNLHGKYEPRDPDKSPRVVFGERLGWLELTASGDIYMLTKENGQIRREHLEKSDKFKMTIDRNRETKSEP